jgi:hypothetical protein
VWVNALKTEVYKEMTDMKRGQPYICFFIDDARFVNEITAFDRCLVNVDVVKVRLAATKEARRERCSYWRDNDLHVSETGLDDYNDWDVMVNTGSVSAEETLDTVVRRVFSPEDFLKRS